MRLENKVALITGAAGEIGRETSVLFGAEGGRVAVVDLDGDGATAVADEILQPAARLSPFAPTYRRPPTARR